VDCGLLVEWRRDRRSRVDVSSHPRGRFRCGVGLRRRRRAEFWPLPASAGLAGRVGDRERTFSARTAMSCRWLMSAPSGLRENAVAERKVRSRRRRVWSTNC